MMSEFVGGPNCHTAGQRRVVMGRARRVVREFWMPGADTATEIVSNECCTASATPSRPGQGSAANSATAHTNTIDRRQKGPFHDRDLVEHIPRWVVALARRKFVAVTPGSVRFAMANPGALRSNAAGPVTIPGIAWSRDSTPRAPPAPSRANASPRRSARAPRSARARTSSRQTPAPPLRSSRTALRASRWNGRRSLAHREPEGTSPDGFGPGARSPLPSAAPVETAARSASPTSSPPPKCRPASSRHGRRCPVRPPLS